MEDELDKIAKIAKSLSVLKEDEITWCKINEIFIKLGNLLSKTDENKLLSLWHKNFEVLLERSVMSERSRLNGTCIDLIQKMNDKFNERLYLFFDPCLYITLLIKISGRFNRVVVQRAENCILKMVRHINSQKLYKSTQQYFTHNNKKVREILYKMVAELDDKSCFSSLIVKGTTDPAIEVRQVIKNMNKEKKKIEEKEKVVIEKEKIIKTNKSTAKTIWDKNVVAKKGGKNKSKDAILYSTLELDNFLEQFKEKAKRDQDLEIKRKVEQRRKELDRSLEKLITKNKMDKFNDSIIAANEAIKMGDTVEESRQKNVKPKKNNKIEVIKSHDEIKDKNEIECKDNQKEIDSKKKKIRTSIESLKIEQNASAKFPEQNFGLSESQIVDECEKFMCEGDSTEIIDDIKKIKKKNKLINLIKEGVFDKKENKKSNKILTRRQVEASKNKNKPKIEINTSGVFTKTDSTENI